MVDKLVDSEQLGNDLTAVANAIRTKSGTSASLSFPNGFVNAISEIATGKNAGYDIKWNLAPSIYLTFSFDFEPKAFMFECPFTSNLIDNYLPVSSKTVNGLYVMQYASALFEGQYAIQKMVIYTKGDSATPKLQTSISNFMQIVYNDETKKWDVTLGRDGGQIVGFAGTEHILAGVPVEGYESFTTTAEYVGYYVNTGTAASPVYTEVTAQNKDSLGITPGVSVAYTCPKGVPYQMIAIGD